VVLHLSFQSSLRTCALKDETRVVAVERGVLEVDHVTQSMTTTGKSSAGLHQGRRLTAICHHQPNDFRHHPPVIFRVSCGLHRLTENGQLAFTARRYTNAVCYSPVSVCLSQSGAASKRLNTSSLKPRLTKAPWTFLTKKTWGRQIHVVG